MVFSVGFFQNIVIVPFLLTHWGKEKYGIWIALFTLFTLIQTFDIGHQNYVGNEFNKFFHLDKNKAREILASGVWMCVSLGLIELAILVIIVVFDKMSDFIGLNLVDINHYKVDISLFVLLFTWILSGNIGGLLV